jgi:putative ABC transport system permease protein
LAEKISMDDWSPWLGAVTYRIIIALVLKMGMPANDLKLFTAITVAVALVFADIKHY